MLVLQNISKTYQTGELIQKALDRVSLELRDNEFVAILGPSGSGKTTLLNIIGGLDRYDEGDLLINGVSTKDYKDRDWDSYRNHSIGFVFQSYNLIPHQNILSNVELALTIGGVSAKERRKRALKALEEVGLKEQAHKKPNQMSGGQMQRVAIARALVNDPDILLADEPTGALDSKTSLQVMELLKEVARDRLVVMVTHNPELANAYATRIVKLKDGQIIADSDPYHASNTEIKQYKKRKAHMSYLTALSLSFHNLLTKKSRTILTSFAGSIGIIGIALILSLSTGFQNYIDQIQEDTLSSYPLTITSETADAASAILSMVSDREAVAKQDGKVKERRYLTSMFSAIGSNDLKSFKKYLETHTNEYKDDVSQIRYSYGISPLIYTIDAAGNLAKLNPSNLLSSMYSSSATSMLSSFSAASGNSVFSEMNDDDSYRDQYKVLAGRWPEKYDELLIVLSEEDAISDLLVYSLGLRDTNELKTIINDVMSGTEYATKDEPKSFAYEDLLNIELKLLKATDIFRYNSQYDIYEDMSSDEEYMRSLYERSLTLKITGIVCAEDRNASMALSTGVAYTKDLTRYVIDEAMNTAIVQKQLRDKEIDVFSHNRFDEENKKEDNIDLQDMISIDEKMLENAFKINADLEKLEFEEINEAEMQEIVMKSAQDAADMIAKMPDATTVTGILSTLNMSMLQQEIERYEQLDGVVMDGYLYLEEEKLDTIRQEIDGKSYKKYAKTLVSSIPELSEYESLTEVLPKEDYEKLAQAVVLMFDDYYDKLKENETYDKENDRIAYDDGDPDNIIYGGTLPRTMLITQELLSNQDALKITSDLVNELINQYTVMMIASQIGMATAQMIEPLYDSLSGISELFEGDLISFDADAFAKAINFKMNEEELSRLMETLMADSSEKSYRNNLLSLGYQDIDEPSSISFYFNDFEGKENFLSFLDRYNSSVDDDTKIRYTDITGFLMNSVKTIVDVVTYVLIAFVSISLVVSSIMIAVITLISVMERTKEIGILRAMGASKRNVSSIFSAETFIIGLLSGTLGIAVTLALLPFVNKIIHHYANNNDVNAILPTQGAIALIIIAVILTMIAGFIPSKKAARQDPVVALRTE